MTITLEAVRAAGGIVHSDGNIFFRDISMLQGLAGAAPAAVAGQVLDARAIAAAVCQRVAELPDRDSPADWPEAMLVTGQELIDVVTCELEQAQAAPQAPAAPSDAQLLSEWDRVSGITKATERRLACMRSVLQRWGSAAPAAPAVDAKAHDWRENASYGGEICAECGAAKGSRRGNAPCAWPPEPLDVCTDPYNCARCKAHPNHRKGLEHAGISRPRSAAQAKEGGAPVADAAPLDVCTDPYNRARCKTHPAHRGDMHHAGISRIGGSA